MGPHTGHLPALQVRRRRRTAGHRMDPHPRRGPDLVPALPRRQPGLAALRTPADPPAARAAGVAARPTVTNSRLPERTPPTMTTTENHVGDRVRSRIHRAGILPISPGDLGTVTGIGLRDYTEPYVLVTVQVAGGAVHTSFAPRDIDIVS